MQQHWEVKREKVSGSSERPYTLWWITCLLLSRLLTSQQNRDSTVCAVSQSVAFCIWLDDRLLAKHQTQATIMALLFQRDSCSIPSALESLFLPIIALFFHWFFCSLYLSKWSKPFFPKWSQSWFSVCPALLSSRMECRSAKVLQLLLTLHWCMYVYTYASHAVRVRTSLFLLALGSSLFSLWRSPLSTNSHCQGTAHSGHLEGPMKSSVFKKQA